MKRGLIAWDRDELPPETLTRRLDRARALAKEHDIAAVVVYTDVWRSNAARFLVNFMPYFNRSLLVVPVEEEPTLLCGLSPRVYPWIQSVTVVSDIRPGKHMAAKLTELAEERGWTRIGVHRLRELPEEIHRGLEAIGLEWIDVDLGALHDERDLAMRRHALALTRPIVDELRNESFASQFELVAHVDRALRRSGMEDVIVWLAGDEHGPRPARAGRIESGGSIVVAAEYRGHWVSLARALEETTHREAYEAFLSDFVPRDTRTVLYDLSGAHPFRAIKPSAAPDDESVVAVHLRFPDGRMFGDTCQMTGSRSATLL